MIFNSGEMSGFITHYLEISEKTAQMVENGCFCVGAGFP